MEPIHISFEVLPNEILSTIISNLSYDEISSLRLVCRKFNEVCKQSLNAGFHKVERYHAECLRKVKGQLPRRESERRVHPLSRRCDVLVAIETRLSLLGMTYNKYIDLNLCCFIPGKVIDEIYRVLGIVEKQPVPPRPHEILQELRDISSMAMEHFDENIQPRLRNLVEPLKRTISCDFITLSRAETGVNSFRMATPSGAVIPFRHATVSPASFPSTSSAAAGSSNTGVAVNSRYETTSPLSSRLSVAEQHQLRDSVCRLRRAVILGRSEQREQSKKLIEMEQRITEQNRIIEEQSRHINEQNQKFAQLGDQFKTLLGQFRLLQTLLPDEIAQKIGPVASTSFESIADLPLSNMATKSASSDEGGAKTAITNRKRNEEGLHQDDSVDTGSPNRKRRRIRRR